MGIAVCIGLYVVKRDTKLETNAARKETNTLTIIVAPCSWEKRLAFIITCITFTAKIIPFPMTISRRFKYVTAANNTGKI